jgi:hypothetical protein
MANVNPLTKSNSVGNITPPVDVDGDCRLLSISKEVFGSLRGASSYQHDAISLFAHALVKGEQVVLKFYRLLI